MIPSKFSVLLARLAVLLSSAWAADPARDTADGDQTSAPPPQLSVRVSTSFPQSEIFGVKLVNGQPTQALLTIINEEPAPVSVAFVGGSLWGPDPKTASPESSLLVRNITSTRYNVQIAAGEKENVGYQFATELHPQELRLSLIAVLSDDKGQLYTVQAYNETVTVVEPDTSFLDPQIIFLYLLLLGLFLGSCYFIYNTWISTLFPQKPRNRGGDRKRSKKIEDQPASPGVDGALGSGAKPYDESWIPEGHINRPEQRRIKSGSKPKKGTKAEAS